MKSAILFLAAISLFCQSRSLSPDAEFVFDAGHKTHHSNTRLQSFFAASPGGLTFVRIGENFVSLQSADLNGRSLYSTTGLVSVRASIYTALLRPDGSFWLVSSGPSNFFFKGPVPGAIGFSEVNRPTSGRMFGQTDSYNDLDLYKPNRKAPGTTAFVVTRWWLVAAPDCCQRRYAGAA